MEYNFSKFYHKWAIAAALINLAGLALAVFLGTYFLWVVAAVFLFGVFIGSFKAFVPRMPLIIGYANWVSFLRLLIVMALFVFYEELTNTELMIGFAIAIALDGLDGFLARRFGHATEAGGQFDMEIDAFMVLVLSYMHFSEGVVHWFILIPGAFRYLFELALIWVEDRRPEILPKRVRSTIAVSFFISLLIPFLTRDRSYLMILNVSGSFILVSFAVSLFSQFKHLIFGSFYSHT